MVRAMSFCVLSSVAWLAACAATSNPSLERVKPLADTMVVPAPAKPPAQTQTPPAQDPAGAAKPEAQKPAAPATTAPLVLGSVGGEPIEVGEFLARLWVRDHRAARDALEQIVFARLAMAEADRLRVVLAPEQVDQVVSKTLAGLEKKLAEGGSKLTVDEHIRSNLDLEPALYKQRLREDAIVQLLAERCVRAWVFENERVDVRVTELRDEVGAQKFRAALDQGRPFAEVALELGAGDDEASRTTPMTIVRAESQELSRLAFATPVGSVGGPLVQAGRWLFVAVERHLDPVVGPWSTIGKSIEDSLGADQVGDLEYIQWRAAMVRRYKVDLEPFLDLVGGGKAQ